MGIKWDNLYREDIRVCDMQGCENEGCESHFYFPFVDCFDTDNQPVLEYMCIECLREVLKEDDDYDRLAAENKRLLEALEESKAEVRYVAGLPTRIFRPWGPHPVGGS